jgi:hypothetical protein
MMVSLARIDGRDGGYVPFRGLLLVEFKEDVSRFKDEYGIIHLVARDWKLVLVDQPKEVVVKGEIIDTKE